MRDDGSFGILVMTICILILIFVLGLFVGGIGNPYNTLTSSSGIPVSNVQMSEDGTFISFNIGNTQLSVSLQKAENRPPNLSTSVRVIITDDQILFLNQEGTNITHAINYQTITILEG